MDYLNPRYIGSLRGAMDGETHVQPLPDSAMKICERCGQPFWVFRTPTGHQIALDAGRGPYLTEGGVARLTDEGIGYRQHSDHCERLARAPLAGVVTEAEYLFGWCST
jgi:hypothetical protein